MIKMIYIVTFDKAAIETAKSLAKDCKCFHSNKNLCKTKNSKMSIFSSVEKHIDPCLTANAEYPNAKYLLRITKVQSQQRNLGI